MLQSTLGCEPSQVKLGAKPHSLWTVSAKPLEAAANVFCDVAAAGTACQCSKEEPPCSLSQVMLLHPCLTGEEYYPTGS